MVDPGVGWSVIATRQNAGNAAYWLAVPGGPSGIPAGGVNAPALTSAARVTVAVPPSGDTGTAVRPSQVLAIAGVTLAPAITSAIAIVCERMFCTVRCMPRGF